MIYYDSNYFRLIWSMYGFRCLVFFCWMGSGHQFFTILKVLHCHEATGTLWKVQNKNCAMASVGSTIVALIAVTSLLLPSVSKVHWLCSGLWITSMLTAFLSVGFSCKHQRFLGNLLLSDDEDLWEFKKFLHEGNKDTAATPRLGVVLLFSGTKMFFDTSLILYAAGLAVYLGCVWKQDLNTDAGENYSRNIFILFLIVVSLCCFVYVGLDIMTSTIRLRGWACYLKWYRDGIRPCMEGCDRKTCPPDNRDNTGTCKQSLLLRMCLFLIPGRSRCRGACSISGCTVPGLKGSQDSQSSAAEYLVPTGKHFTVWYYFTDECKYCKDVSPIFDKCAISEAFKDVKFDKFKLGKRHKWPVGTVPNIRIFKEGKMIQELDDSRKCIKLEEYLTLGGVA